MAVKSMKGKAGPRSVDPASKGSSPSGVVAGGPGKSPKSKGVAGPSGKPFSFKKGK
jgi:hypothetical protein